MSLSSRNSIYVTGQVVFGHVNWNSIMSLVQILLLSHVKLTAVFLFPSKCFPSLLSPQSFSVFLHLISLCHPRTSEILNIKSIYPLDLSQHIWYTGVTVSLMFQLLECWYLTINNFLTLDSPWSPSCSLQLLMLTSTESFFPKANKRGCILRSGSLWKQFGLAWCWLCRCFHQLADPPCKKGGQSLQTVLPEENTFRHHVFSPHESCTLLTSLVYSGWSPSRRHFWPPRRPLPLLISPWSSTERSLGQVLTCRKPITKWLPKWFHLGLLKTERCPKSCCRKPFWTWKRKGIIDKKL